MAAWSGMDKSERGRWEDLVFRSAPSMHFGTFLACVPLSIPAGCIPALHALYWSVDLG
jgi:hypothetical protein